MNKKSRYEIVIEDNFDFLSVEYQELFQDAEDITAFQAPFWLDAIYNDLVPALNAEPVILVIREGQTNKLLAVLPLVRQRSFSLSILQPVDLGISDYNSIIGKKSDLEALVQDQRLLKELSKLLNPLDILLFRKQERDAFNVGHFLPDAHISRAENSAYRVLMPNGYDDWYRNRFSKNQRKNAKRRRRKLTEEVGPLEFRVLTAPEDIEKAMIFTLAKRSERFESDLLQRDEYYKFYLNLAKKYAAQGDVVVCASEVNGTLITTDYCLAAGKSQYLLLSAFDENFATYSPGILALLEILERFSEEGMEIFDFTIGDEPYKLRFQPEKIELSNVIVTKGILGFAARLAYSNDSIIKRLLKKLSPKIR